MVSNASSPQELPEQMQEFRKRWDVDAIISFNTLHYRCAGIVKMAHNDGGRNVTPSKTIFRRIRSERSRQFHNMELFWPHCLKPVVRINCPYFAVTISRLAIYQPKIRLCEKSQYSSAILRSLGFVWISHSFCTSVVRLDMI